MVYITSMLCYDLGGKGNDLARSSAIANSRYGLFGWDQPTSEFDRAVRTPSLMRGKLYTSGCLTGF
jgi:hypothetical protein